MKMRNRQKGRERSETLTSISKGKEAIDEEKKVGEEEGNGFFACYLLCSLCPRFKGHTYIGFTVNPCRRIRQHNGELRSGAWRTKSKRPWEMILCIYGFPTNVTALQFEWAWQHPTESLAVRKAAASLKALTGIVGKIKLAYTMLTLPPWQSLKLTVNFFSTKYLKDAVGCKSFPKQMKVQYCPMDELPCYTGCEQIFDEMDYEVDEDEDEDGENGTNPRHLEGPVYNMLKRNDTDTIRQPGEPFAQRVEDKPPPVMEENQPEEAETSRAEDHIPLYHLVDSPPLISSRNTKLVNTVEAVEDTNPLVSIKMKSTEFGRATKQEGETPTAAKEHQPFTGNGLLCCLEFSCNPIDLSSPIEEDRKLQFSLVDTPVENPHFSNSGLVMTVEDNDPHGLIQESSDLEVLSPKRSPTTPSYADNNQSPSTKSLLASPKVEVIDISTPSSNSIISYFRKKKRRNNWVSQEIVDLTESPKIVQL